MEARTKDKCLHDACMVFAWCCLHDVLERWMAVHLPHRDSQNAVVREFHNRQHNAAAESAGVTRQLQQRQRHQHLARHSHTRTQAKQHGAAAL